MPNFKIPNFRSLLCLGQLSDDEPPAGPPQSPARPPAPASLARRSSVGGNHPLLVRIAGVQGNTGFHAIRQSKFFKLIDSLSEACGSQDKPLALEDIKALLPNASLNLDRGHADYPVEHHRSASFALPDSYVVDYLDVRVRADDHTVLMFGMGLCNALFDQKTLEAQVGTLGIMFSSSHGPVREAYYVAQRAWGEMRFGFDPARPGILQSVIFDRKP